MEHGGEKAEAWDLGLETLGCSACTWTHHTSSNKTQRNYKRLKNSLMHAQLGQIMNKKQKDQKPNCHLQKARSKNKVLLTPLAHNTTKG